MYAIMGGTGHVGTVVVETLLELGQPVSLLCRDASHAERWRARGAKVVETSVEDPPALRAALQTGRRAFLLNPPADVAEDTDAVERRRVANIIAALEESGLEKVVAQSTGGARPGERVGDLTVLWEFEEGLRRQPIPAAINRAGFYMSNWDSLAEVVRSTGRMPAFFPVDLPMPMVAPADVGRMAAQRLLSPTTDVGVRYIEGPARYTVRELADTFGAVLGRSVEIDVIPPESWRRTLHEMGFSAAAADSFARMIAVLVDEGFDLPADTLHGTTTLETYIRELLARS